MALRQFIAQGCLMMYVENNHAKKKVLVSVCTQFGVRAYERTSCDEKSTDTRGKSKYLRDILIEITPAYDSECKK